MKFKPSPDRTRRWFFNQCGVGLGAMALGNLLAEALRQIGDAYLEKSGAVESETAHYTNPHKE